MGAYAVDLVKAAAVVLSVAVVLAVVLHAVCLVKTAVVVRCAAVVLAVVLAAVCLVKPAVALVVAIPVCETKSGTESLGSRLQEACKVTSSMVTGNNMSKVCITSNENLGSAL